MGKITGFLEYPRSLRILGNAGARLKNWDEFHSPMPDEAVRQEGARCMNCGIPFCHTGSMDHGVTIGCPLHNLIPEWNDLVYHGKWHDAYRRLASTNNFPEFTGRVCPAPCETSCVLGISEDPVAIKEIEVSIIDKAFAEGWVSERTPKARTGKTAAIIGSGPAGLACADDLNRHGHSVTIFEREDRAGGLLMYGIPNMKLDKAIVQRRVELLSSEGITFRTGINVDRDVAGRLIEEFDAVVFCSGAPKPRDLAIDGRHLQGIHFAMDFLRASTKAYLESDACLINVNDQDVVVIGGGDTGTDCIATSLRQGAKSVVQFEILGRATERTISHEGWLSSARTFKSDYGHDEAIAAFGNDPREYSVVTKGFVGDERGILKGLETVQVNIDDGAMIEIPDSRKLWPCDAVFLAMGFSGGEDELCISGMGIEIDPDNKIVVDEKKLTSCDNVFAAGDCERGQSLIVWAMADGKAAAASVHKYLISSSA